MLRFDRPLSTRIAPSPTGQAHIGLVRTAYLNYLAARATGGRFILRIDDTDRERSRPEFERNILDTLEWLGLEYDELHRQSERFEIYRNAADELLAAGRAERRDGALFLKPDLWLREWEDAVSGTVPITDKEREVISNLVLLRADGSPTYHFASCLDDIEMRVNCVIRGTDHIPNTAKHVHIYAAYDAALPRFAHVGLIFHQGKKISKRDGVSDMSYYRDRFSADAVLNAVLKLGWGHPDPEIDRRLPLISKETALHVFPEGHLKSAKSTLDLAKLEWLEKKYDRFRKASPALALV